MKRLGFHVSIAGGLPQLIPRARYRHCNAVQMFTSSPSQWGREPLDRAVAREFRERMAQADIQPHFVHAAYLLNLASPDRVLRRRSVRHLAEELQRAELIGAAGVILHLGSRGEHGRREAAVRRLARALEETRARAGNPVPLVLENSAGAGYTLGDNVAEIARIISLAPGAEPLRFCLDTAHAFAAGWPLHTAEGLEQALGEVQSRLEGRAMVVHVNDSLHPFGSRRDRHWHLGQGQIGREALRRLVNHPLLGELPLIMETPGTAEDDRRNMRALRRLLPPEQRPPLRRVKAGATPNLHARRTAV